MWSFKFNCVIDMLGLPTTAAAFQAGGITTLIYDSRGAGISDGVPRNDINPFCQVDDLSDALTFLASHSSIDSRQGIGLWGMSLSATVAMTTAALDRRARFVIAVCPATEPTYTAAKLTPLLAKATKDRESRIKGNDPFYVPVITKTGNTPLGLDLGFAGEGIRHRLQVDNDTDSLRVQLAPNYADRTTVGSYRNILLWEPSHMWKYLTQPVLFVLSESDSLIGSDMQLRHYENLPGLKRLHIAAGTNHMNIIDGKGQQKVNEAQVMFVRDVLGNRLEKP